MSPDIPSNVPATSLHPYTSRPLDPVTNTNPVGPLAALRATLAGRPQRVQQLPNTCADSRTRECPPFTGVVRNPAVPRAVVQVKDQALAGYVQAADARWRNVGVAPRTPDSLLHLAAKAGQQALGLPVPLTQQQKWTQVKEFGLQSAAVNRWLDFFSLDIRRPTRLTSYLALSALEEMSLTLCDYAKKQENLPLSPNLERCRGDAPLPQALTKIYGMPSAEKNQIFAQACAFIDAHFSERPQTWGPRIVAGDPAGHAKHVKRAKKLIKEALGHTPPDKKNPASSPTSRDHNVRGLVLRCVNTIFRREPDKVLVLDALARMGACLVLAKQTHGDALPTFNGMHEALRRTDH